MVRLPVLRLARTIAPVRNSKPLLRATLTLPDLGSKATVKKSFSIAAEGGGAAATVREGGRRQ